MDEMSPVPFDATTEEDEVPWLDMQLKRYEAHVVVRTHFKPMITAPSWACEMTELRSRVMGMVARLHQCEATLDDVIKEVMNIMDTLAACG